MKNKLIKDYFYNTLLLISNIIFPILTFPYINRILGPSYLGKINFIQSLVYYSLIIAGVGIPLYGVREISRCRNNQDEINKTFSELVIINMLSTLLVVMAYFFLTTHVPKLNEDKGILYIFSISLFFNFLSVDWFYKGVEEYKYISLRNIFIKFISIFFIFIFIKMKKDYYIYIYIIVGNQLLINLTNLLYLRGKIKFSIKNINLKRHINGLGIIFMIYAINNLYSNLDKIMLGFLKGDYAVGIYSTAHKFILLLQPFIVSLSLVLLPKLSFYIKENKKKEFYEALDKSLDYVNFIAIPSSIGIFILSPQIIKIFAGNEFADSIICLRFFSILLLILGLGNVFSNQILIPLKKEKYILYSVIVGCISNFILNIILIKKYSYLGAVVATISSEMIVLIIQYIFVLKVLERKFYIIKFRYLISSLIMGSFVFLLSILIIKKYVLLLLLGSLLGASIYIFSLYILKDKYIRLVVKKIKMRLIKC